jgi:hypothetical protein
MQTTRRLEMKSVVATIAVGAALAAALAAPADASEVQTSTITNVRVRPNVVYYKLSSCPNYALIYITNDYYKSMVALVLSAAAMGTTVQAWLNDSCSSTEPSTEYIDVQYR